jgi:hypothetical protein
VQCRTSETVIHPRAAGIDVHPDMHMVCVPADGVPPGTGGDGGLPANVRQFGANSYDLHAIADWLAACGVTTVAMESTGVYWVPLFELLEARGFQVWLVEPGQLSRCGARPKTDLLDVQWIQRLHAYDLLQPSFRPPQAPGRVRLVHAEVQPVGQSPVRPADRRREGAAEAGDRGAGPEAPCAVLGDAPGWPAVAGRAGTGG